MASRGSDSLGYTEMKGSWFIFDSYRAHEDWCRWRAGRDVARLTRPAPRRWSALHQGATRFSS
jgi:hypothetical protein